LEGDGEHGGLRQPLASEAMGVGGAWRRHLMETAGTEKKKSEKETGPRLIRKLDKRGFTDGRHVRNPCVDIVVRSRREQNKRGIKSRRGRGLTLYDAQDVDKRCRSNDYPKDQ